jgi:hypothetical protein
MIRVEDKEVEQISGSDRFFGCDHSIFQSFHLLFTTLFINLLKLIISESKRFAFTYICQSFRH